MWYLKYRLVSFVNVCDAFEDSCLIDLSGHIAQELGRDVRCIWNHLRPEIYWGIYGNIWEYMGIYGDVFFPVFEHTHTHTHTHHTHTQRDTYNMYSY